MGANDLANFLNNLIQGRSSPITNIENSMSVRLGLIRRRHCQRSHCIANINIVTHYIAIAPNRNGLLLQYVTEKNPDSPLLRMRILLLTIGIGYTRNYIIKPPQPVE